MVHTKAATSPEPRPLHIILELRLRTRKLKKEVWGGDRASPTWLISLSFRTDSPPDLELTLNVYRINGLGFQGEEVENGK